MVDRCAIRGDSFKLKKKQKKHAKCGVLNSDVQYIKKVLVFNVEIILNFNVFYG